MTAFDLSTLPRPSDKRLAVRVTKDAVRQVRGGHPWVFDASITSVRGDGAAGDLAVIFDDARDFVAIGLFDPTSPIRIRVLHHGAPATIDAAWWAARIDAAIGRRAPLAQGHETNAYRVVHGENDGMPGLVLDRYASSAVLKLYTGAWIPHLAVIVPIVRERLGFERLIVRLSRELQRTGAHGLVDGAGLVGTAPDAPVLFTENGLTFEADIVHGQKTGHFLDQRENRARVRALSEGARVLDVFACTGGFSVHAAAGGATSVHSVDLSTPAIETVTRNMDHNRDLPAVRSSRHRSTVGDAFGVLRDLAAARERYDVVVIDPPSFAAKQADVPGGLRAYRKLTELGVAVVDAGGVLVQSSCSSRIAADVFFAAVVGASRDAGVDLDELARTQHALDHPIGFAHGAYLKTLFARVR